MADGEQARPLAPATDRPASDDEEAAALQQKKSIRRRRCIICGGCVAAFLVIIAIVIIVLFFTIFRVRNPTVTLNDVTITDLEQIRNTQIPNLRTNMTFLADFSIKNPNYASFKFDNFTALLDYYGTSIGEARVPPGNAQARRTIHLNVTVEIIMDELLPNPNLGGDVMSGLFNISTYADIFGRVNMLDIIKRNIEVQSNCSVSVNITTQGVEEQHCRNKVDF